MFVRRDLSDTVPTREGNMHYVKQGSGFPLVMLHPLGTSTWAWHTVIDSLSQHYTCYAFDMLGHGESDKPTRHFNMLDYAQALDDACQLLNIHRGHYLGNSVGACLATEMAVSFPDRLDKLVLVGCPVWDHRTASQRLQDSAGDYDDNGLPKPRDLGRTERADHLRRSQAGVGRGYQSDPGSGRCLGRQARPGAGQLRYYGPPTLGES